MPKSRSKSPRRSKSRSQSPRRRKYKKYAKYGGGIAALAAAAGVGYHQRKRIAKLLGLATKAGLTPKQAVKIVTPKVIAEVKKHNILQGGGVAGPVAWEAHPF
jgi:hypothetical protein